MLPHPHQSQASPIAVARSGRGEAARPKRRKAAPPPIASAIAFTVDHAAVAVGVSRSRLFRMIKDGELRSVFVAGRRLIPTDALRELLAAGRAEDPGLEFRRRRSVEASIKRALRRKKADAT